MGASQEQARELCDAAKEATEKTKVEVLRPLERLYEWLKRDKAVK